MSLYNLDHKPEFPKMKYAPAGGAVMGANPPRRTVARPRVVGYFAGAGEGGRTRALPVDEPTPELEGEPEPETSAFKEGQKVKNSPYSWRSRSPVLHRHRSARSGLPANRLSLRPRRLSRYPRASPSCASRACLPTLCQRWSTSAIPPERPRTVILSPRGNRRACLFRAKPF